MTEERDASPTWREAVRTAVANYAASSPATAIPRRGYTEFARTWGPRPWRGARDGRRIPGRGCLLYTPDSGARADLAKVRIGHRPDSNILAASALHSAQTTTKILLAAVGQSRSDALRHGRYFHQLHEQRPRLGVLDRQGAGSPWSHASGTRMGDQRRR